MLWQEVFLREVEATTNLEKLSQYTRQYFGLFVFLVKFELNIFSKVT